MINITQIINISVVCITSMIMSANLVYAAPKKDANKEKSKEISKGSKDRRVSRRDYHQMERSLNNIPEEQRNIILQAMNNPDTYNDLMQRAVQEAKDKGEGSSASKQDDSKK